MFLFNRYQLLLLVFALTSPWIAGFAQQPVGSLHVRGYAGEATLVRVNGRAYVDLEAFLGITGSSVSVEGGQTVLTLRPDQSAEANASSSSAAAVFSRPFMSAAIEAIASMREWGSTLVVAIRNGYPVGNSINPYRGRAVDKIRLAAAAVSTDDDRNGMELLQREFSNVQAWSDKLVKARNSMSAANLTMSEDALQRDPLFQDIVNCGQFLGQMLANGSFQSGGVCR